VAGVVSFEPLRRYAASLPGATRDVKWGADECYSVGGKMFAVFGVERGKGTSLSFKVDPERFLELTDVEGIIPAPYLARAHWVQLETANAIPPHDARALIARSHALIAAKLTKKAREAALGAKPARPR
jgi:predicted DNA-binding protein (MmcQ/YjbR family)